MRDFVVLDELPTDMMNIRAVISAERWTDADGNRLNDDKRIVVLRHLDPETIESVFQEDGEKIKHRHVVIATRYDGAKRTWFCTKRDEARDYVKKVKATNPPGEDRAKARYVSVKV